MQMDDTEYSDLQVKVRFDAGEALKELERLGLATSNGNSYEASDPKDALPKLQSHWADLLIGPKQKLHSNSSKDDSTSPQLALQNWLS